MSTRPQGNVCGLGQFVVQEYANFMFSHLSPKFPEVSEEQAPIDPVVSFRTGFWDFMEGS